MVIDSQLTDELNEDLGTSEVFNLFFFGESKADSVEAPTCISTKQPDITATSMYLALYGYLTYRYLCFYLSINEHSGLEFTRANKVLA